MTNSNWRATSCRRWEALDHQHKAAVVANTRTDGSYTALQKHLREVECDLERYERDRRPQR